MPRTEIEDSLESDDKSDQHQIKNHIDTAPSLSSDPKIASSLDPMPSAWWWSQPISVLSPAFALSDDARVEHGATPSDSAGRPESDRQAVRIPVGRSNHCGISRSLPTTDDFGIGDIGHLGD
jgi:hypothetical protein